MPLTSPSLVFMWSASPISRLPGVCKTLLMGGTPEVRGGAGWFSTDKHQGCAWTLVLSPHHCKGSQSAVLPAARIKVFGRNQTDAMAVGNNREWGSLEHALSLGIMALESGVKTLRKMLSPRFRMGQTQQHWDENRIQVL